MTYKFKGVKMAKSLDVKFYSKYKLKGDTLEFSKENLLQFKEGNFADRLYLVLTELYGEVFEKSLVDKGVKNAFADLDLTLLEVDEDRFFCELFGENCIGFYELCSSVAVEVVGELCKDSILVYSDSDVYSLLTALRISLKERTQVKVLLLEETLNEGYEYIKNKKANAIEVLKSNKNSIDKEVNLEEYLVNFAKNNNIECVIYDDGISLAVALTTLYSCYYDVVDAEEKAVIFALPNLAEFYCASFIAVNSGLKIKLCFSKNAGGNFIEQDKILSQNKEGFNSKSKILERVFNTQNTALDNSKDCVSFDSFKRIKFNKNLYVGKCEDQEAEDIIQEFIEDYDYFLSANDSKSLKCALDFYNTTEEDLPIVAVFTESPYVDAVKVYKIACEEYCKDYKTAVRKLNFFSAIDVPNILK